MNSIGTLPMPTPDYSTVAETPGLGSSPEQLAMLFTRYAFAAKHCSGKRVLEVACGAGLGLDYIRRHSAGVIGGDCTDGLLRLAKRANEGAIPLVQLDAHKLPFHAQCLDLIILFEALYYLSEPMHFLAECRRVLSPRGIVLVSSVNKEWSDFNPSPFHTRYFSSQELKHLLEQAGFRVELRAAFPHIRTSSKDHLVSLLKRLSVKLRLIPRTMRGKLWLKRVFFGRLFPIPSAITDGLAVYNDPVVISHNRPVRDFKILFAVARLA